MRYEQLHWGTQPTGIETMRWLGEVPAVAVGELAAISYASVKASEPTIYRHEFEPHEGRLPRLLEHRPGGRLRTPSLDAGDKVELGRVIDLELVDGRRVATPFLRVVTDGDHGHVILASRFDPIYAIEHRGSGRGMRPFVTARGIEG